MSMWALRFLIKLNIKYKYFFKQNSQLKHYQYFLIRNSIFFQFFCVVNHACAKFDIILCYRENVSIIFVATNRILEPSFDE